MHETHNVVLLPENLERNEVFILENKEIDYHENWVQYTWYLNIPKTPRYDEIIASQLALVKESKAILDSSFTHDKEYILKLKLRLDKESTDFLDKLKYFFDRLEMINFFENENLHFKLNVKDLIKIWNDVNSTQEYPIEEFYRRPRVAEFLMKKKI
jgi:hypothetical protein